MGTAGRLTAEVAQAETEIPGFLPALEAGQTRTFGISRTTRFMMLGAGVLFVAGALYVLLFEVGGLSRFSWDNALTIALGLALFGFGVWGLRFGQGARISRLTLRREGLEVRHWNGGAERLRWDEVAKVEPLWTGRVRVTSPSGRQVILMDSNFDDSEDLRHHLQGVAWFNRAHAASGSDLPRAVRAALRADALRFVPLKNLAAVRRARWWRLAGFLAFSAAAAFFILEVAQEEPWEEILILVFLCALPFWEAYRLRSFLTGYDAVIEVSRKGITARQPNAGETRLTWAQLEGAELEDSRRGVEIVAPAGRIGVGELEHAFFFWDVLGLMREDLRDEIYDLVPVE